MLDDARVITGRPVTVGAAFAAERPQLLPLPGEAFDPARLLQARVDNRARVSVRQCYYSVPARYAGRRLAVRLSATTVEVLDGATSWPATSGPSAATSRSSPWTTTWRCSRRKPGALPGATALAQAKACGCVHRDAPGLLGRRAPRAAATRPAPGR